MTHLTKPRMDPSLRALLWCVALIGAILLLASLVEGAEGHLRVTTPPGGIDVSQECYEGRAITADGKHDPPVPIYVPSKEWVATVQQEIVRRIQRMVADGKLLSARGDHCPYEYPDWSPPQVVYAFGPIWVPDAIVGREVKGAWANGVSAGNAIVVRCDLRADVRGLVLWESANSLLIRAVGRGDLTDGPAVSHLVEGME